MFRLNWNKQKTHPNSFIESIFGYFSENLGLFRFVTKQFCLFWLFRYRFETPKQTETFCFWFHETNRNKRETDLVSVCFGSNRNLFLFVSRTPYSHLFLSSPWRPLLLTWMFSCSLKQCCGSGMFVPVPRSWFLPIPDPGSQVPDPGSKNSNKREGWKIFFVIPFM